jgi:hypothetical protein
MLTIRLIPLLSLAIGAFFLEWQFNLAVFAALFVLTAVHGAGTLKKALRNLLALTVFTLPILLIKLFTVKEGLLVKIWFFELYSNALFQCLNTWLRVLIFALASFIALEIWFPVRQWKKVRERYQFLDLLFSSVELYQNMLRDFVAFFRKKGKKHNLADFIDEAYTREWKNLNGKK